MNDIETIGVGFDTSGLKKGQEALSATLAAATKTADGVDKVTDATKRVPQGTSVMASALNQLQGSVTSLERQVASHTAALERHAATYARTADGAQRYEAALRGATTAQQRHAEALERHATALDQSDAAARRGATGMGVMNTATRALAAGITVLFGALTVSKLADMADAVTNLDSRLKLVTTSTRQASVAYQEIFKMAQESRVSFTDLGNTYAQMARVTREVGISQERMLAVTKTVSQAVTLSGSSATSANAALIQLSQGLASGTLRGEELNSVMEQTPALAQAIAQGLGVTIGQLRAMGAAGEITGEKVIEALERMSSSVERDFKQMDVTIGQSVTRMTNSVTNLVGELNKLTGASSALTSAWGGVSTWVDTLSSSVRKLNENRPLYAAAQDLATLNSRVELLRERLARGFQVERTEEELRRLSVQLEVAKEKFRQLDATMRGGNATPNEKFRTSELSTYAAEAAKQRRIETQLMETRQRLSGVTDSYMKDLRNLEEAYRTGVIPTEAEYVRLVTDLAQKNYKKSDADKAASKAAKDHARELAAQEKLLTELSGLAGDFYEDWDALDQLYKRNRISLDQLTASQATLLAKQPAIRKAAKELKDAQEREAQETEEAAKAYDKQAEALDRSATKLREEIQRQKEAAAAIRGGAVAVADLEAAKLEETAATQLRNAALADEIDWSGALGDRYREEAKLLRELASLKRSNAADRAAEDTAKKAREEWERATDKIGDSLTDALMRGFEAGKGFGRTFADAVKNMFKTMVLQPVIKAIVSPVAGMVQSAIGSLLGGGGGVGGSILSSVIGSAAGSATGALSFGNLVGAAGGDGLGAMIAANGGFGTMSAGGSAMGMLSAIPGWGWASAAALALLGSGAFKGETRSGGHYGWAPGSGAAFLHGPSGGDPAGAQVAQLLNASGTNMNALLAGMGTGLSVSSLQGAYESSDKDRGGVYFGGTLSNGLRFGESGQGSNYDGTLYETASARSLGTDAALTNLVTDVAQGQVQMLQALARDGALPRVVAKMVEGVDAEALSNDAATALINTVTATVNAANSLRTALEALPFEHLKNLSFDAAEALARYSGGAENFLANLSTYSSNYLTPAERNRLTASTIQSQLGSVGYNVTVDDVLGAAGKGNAGKDMFRSVVEAYQSRTDEEGQRVYAMLLALSGGFAELSASMSQTVDAVEDVVAELEDALTPALDALRAATERELAVARAAEAAAQERTDSLRAFTDALTGSLRGLQRQVASTLPRRAAAGQAFVTTSLAQMRAGAGLPATDKLTAAIDDANSGIDASRYASRFAMDRDRLRLAAQVAAMKDLGLEQLSEAEKQLAYSKQAVEALESGLEYWERMVDEAQNGVAATLTVAEAVRHLSALLGGAKSAAGAAGATGVQGGAASFGPGAGAAGSGAASGLPQSGYIVGAGGIPVDIIGHAMANLDDPAAIAAFGQSVGATMEDYARLTGQSLGDVQTWFRLKGGIPSFDTGTNYLPRDMVVQAHEGEAIVPKKFNPAAGGNIATPAIEAMRNDMRAQHSAAQEARNAMLKVFQKWDARGLPATRSEA